MHLYYLFFTFGSCLFLRHLFTHCHCVYVCVRAGGWGVCVPSGVIVSTPTGSTAYAVAAGASMIHPNVPAIMITPICPHSLSFRPIVVPAGVELKVLVTLSWVSRIWISLYTWCHTIACYRHWLTFLVYFLVISQIMLSCDARNTAWVSFDGRKRQEICHGDRLVYMLPRLLRHSKTKPINTG